MHEDRMFTVVIDGQSATDEDILSWKDVQRVVEEELNEKCTPLDNIYVFELRKVALCITNRVVDFHELPTDSR